MDSVPRIRDACAGLSEREERPLSTEVAWSPDQTGLTRGRDAVAVEQWLRGIAQGVCGPFFLRYDEDRSSINLASNSRAPDHRLNHLKSYKQANGRMLKPQHSSPAFSRGARKGDASVRARKGRARPPRGLHRVGDAIWTTTAQAHGWLQRAVVEPPF